MRHPILFYVLAVILTMLSTLSILETGVHSRWDADTLSWTGAIDDLVDQTDQAVTILWKVFST